MLLEAIINSPPISLGIFAAAALTIAAAGVALSGIADELADRTGWGEALVGALFLAGATSLPDFAATITAAANDRPQLAVSNMMGSMALNLAFLGVGDMLYRRANLEHAAASAPNMIQAALLIGLIAIPLLAMVAPPVALGHVHPASIALPIAYVFGFMLTRQSQTRPMWQPRRTAQTVEDRPDPGKGSGRSLVTLWLIFAGLTLTLAVAGWALMIAAEGVIALTGFSETLVGTLFTAVSTSSPELVTTIAAIRRGALALAVGGIVGTNCFNVTAIAAADFAYRGGSIYSAMADEQIFWGLLTILMTAVLLLGFVRRERYGIGKIGFESALMLSLYAAGVVLVIVVEGA